MFSRTRTELPYTAVEAMMVQPEKEAAFIEWDRRYNEAMEQVPGWLGSETLAPQLPEQPEWIVTARWATRDDMVRFSESEIYRRFEAAGDLLRERPSTVEFFEGEAPSAADASRIVTSILYWTVPPDTEKDFAGWHAKYAQAMSESPGFQGYQLQEPLEDLPVVGDQNDWVEVVRWDSVFARDNWIRSAERRRMLELGNDFYTGMKARNVRTSFEGWFRFDSSTAGSPTPTWKQSMVVLLILYPTVFLLTEYVTGPLEWPLWSSLFLGNVLSVALMGFVITPLVMRYALGWWLNPMPTANPHRLRWGIWIILGCYAIFLVLFAAWPDT